MLVKQDAPEGRVLSRRQSPKRGTLLDIFDELVYFTRVFPHPRLTMEVVLVEVEEWRYPGHGRRRRWRRNDQVVADQKLVSVGRAIRLSSAADLIGLIPPLPQQFHTGHLAELAGIHRWVAQRIAYCLREMNAVEHVGKQGNALVYRLPTRRRRRRRRRRGRLTANSLVGHAAFASALHVLDVLVERAAGGLVGRRLPRGSAARPARRRRRRRRCGSRRRRS